VTATRVRRALAVVAVGLAVAASAAQSPEERRRLTAGEVVVRDVMPPGATPSARGGTALALVRASPEEVWRVLNDYPGHPRFYPRVVAAELVERDDRRALVRYEVGIGPFSFTFHMHKYPDASRRRVEWRLAEGYSSGLFRENSGFWQLDPEGDATVVTYGIAVRTVLPKLFTGAAERDSLVETVTALRRVVEGGPRATR
jgi:ribosome-associated toxin RatA of RatAB toxin-antitoxin module